MPPLGRNAFRGKAQIDWLLPDGWGAAELLFQAGQGGPWLPVPRERCLWRTDWVLWPWKLLPLLLANWASLPAPRGVAGLQGTAGAVCLHLLHLRRKSEVTGGGQVVGRVRELPDSLSAHLRADFHARFLSLLERPFLTWQAPNLGVLQAPLSTLFVCGVEAFFFSLVFFFFFWANSDTVEGPGKGIWRNLGNF